jgi:hypothetical protein
MDATRGTRLRRAQGRAASILAQSPEGDHGIP